MIVNVPQCVLTNDVDVNAFARLIGVLVGKIQCTVCQISEINLTF